MGVAIAVRARGKSKAKDPPVIITFVLKARLGDTWALFHFLIRKMVSLSNLLHIDDMIHH